ncbi:hypothetical protein CEXT_334301 [Caerostris extrusa]|uniref:Uncharacterized protein n=1 Tax=Caerostris extrusa TaxID=172846 RepID=A0AAV4SHC4_CAEEX|nr:hypothetical protein CEXT_334301 [Caerostris extrusa]
MTLIGIKQVESYFKPQRLGSECDIYLSSRVKVKPGSNLPGKCPQFTKLSFYDRVEVVKEIEGKAIGSVCL